MRPHGPAMRGGSASGPSTVRSKGEPILALARRALFRTVILGLVLVWSPHIRADRQGLPIALEAELLAKVLNYDRTFPERAGDVARLLIVAKRGNADSVRAAFQMRTALRLIDRVGGLPHEEIELEYAGPKALAEICDSKNIAVAYFGPGFDNDLETIRAALDGHEILTVASVPQYVPRGIVLGFDVIAGSPKLLFNLRQAKRQNIWMSAELLKMMRLFE
jgi:uncharacterized protein DUF4154